MKNSLKTINEVQNHFGLEIGESYDAFCNLCFADEKEKKHFNLNLAVCLYDQRFLVEEALKDEHLKRKFIKSVQSVAKLGRVIDSKYMYVYPVFGKKQSTTLELQYQAKWQILEHSGVDIVYRDYVLHSEFDDFKKIDMLEIATRHVKYKDIKKRTEIDMTKCDFYIDKIDNKQKCRFPQDIACGYVVYDYKGERRVFLLEKDKLEISFQTTMSKETKSGEKLNLKYKTKDGILITLIHRLYDELKLKDMDSEDYDYNEVQKAKQITALDLVKDANPKDMGFTTQEHNEDIKSKDIEEGITKEEDIKNVFVDNFIDADSQTNISENRILSAEEQEILAGNFSIKEGVSSKTNKPYKAIVFDNLTGQQGYKKQCFVNSSKDGLYLCSLNENIKIKFKDLTEESIMNFTVCL